MNDGAPDVQRLPVSKFNGKVLWAYSVHGFLITLCFSVSPTLKHVSSVNMTRRQPIFSLFIATEVSSDE